jgi:hypothetical protein
MCVVRHEDEGVKLKAILGSLFLEDVEEEDCVLFDLEEASAVGGDDGYEIRSEFLWGSWHEWRRKEYPGLKPLQNCA